MKLLDPELLRTFIAFADAGSLARAAAAVAEGLRRQGVLVRYYDRPLLQNCIRISAGRPEDTDRLVEALKTLEVS